MFITFNTKSQALNYIKRNQEPDIYQGCGCCFYTSSLFLDGDKVVLSRLNSHQGAIVASATIIGKIKKKKVQ